MSETPVPKNLETLTAALLCEETKKEWQNLPEGAWERDLQAMAEILPAGILPLYQTLALNRQVSEKSGSQNRMHLATIAALTETGDKAVWTNKKTAGEVMEAVRSALGDRYPDLLNEWDQGKSDTFSLLSAARIVVGELGFSQAEEKTVAGEPVAVLMQQIDALSASTQKKIQALVVAVLGNLDSEVDLEALQEELQRSGIEPATITAWHEQLKKQRAASAVKAWEKMKTGGEINKIWTVGWRLTGYLMESLQIDLANPEKKPGYYSVKRDWQTKLGYFETWVGTAEKPGKLAALFGGGEDGVATARQAFETIWTGYLRGMGVDVLPDGKAGVQLSKEVLDQLPQFGEKVIKQAVSLVIETLFETGTYSSRGKLKTNVSFLQLEEELVGPKGFLVKALGDRVLAQAIFEKIKERLLMPVERIAGQGGELFNTLTEGGERIVKEFVKDMADLIGQGKTEAELLEDPLLVEKYGQILSPEQRQQLIQKGLEVYKQGAEESLAKPDKLIEQIKGSLAVKVEEYLQQKLEQIVSAIARGDGEMLQQQLKLWEKRTGVEFPQELVEKIKTAALDKDSIGELLRAFEIALATVKAVKKKE